VKSELQRLLGNGEPMLSTELESEVCKVTGCHANTIAAAKKDLGVEARKIGNQWFSVLPSKNTEKGQEHNK
jgi:hypothetical protein